jgi:hypothetical protein
MEGEMFEKFPEFGTLFRILLEQLLEISKPLSMNLKLLLPKKGI